MYVCIYIYIYIYIYIIYIYIIDSRKNQQIKKKVLPKSIKATHNKNFVYFTKVIKISKTYIVFYTIFIFIIYYNTSNVSFSFIIIINYNLNY